MDPNPPKSYALSGKIMLSSIIILLAVVVIMVVLHIYARWYLLRIRRRYLRRRRQRANQIVFYVDPTTTPGNGLDASILNSLPTFAYSARTGGLECAICLSEFEDNEMGRKLPGCHHSFHIDCIDMWFHSHSTCPICRSTVEVESEPQDKNKIISKPETDPVPILVREPGSSSGLSERRKGLDLSGVRIEVPRRSELDDESRSANHEFRSPLYSLRRILSMKRRTTPSSPSGGSGSGAGSSSRGYVGADPDIESGRSESTRPQTPR